jgi:hypothetical protein
MPNITAILLIAATLFNGLMAGVTADRGLVGWPAWKHVGRVAWATYSRNADLKSGMVVYPVLSIGGTILSVAAVLAGVHASFSPRILWPMAATAVLAFLGLMFTLRAGPYILRLRRVSNSDRAGLERAFGGFYFWSFIRGILQIGAFLAGLWGLLAMLSTRP